MVAQEQQRPEVGKARTVAIVPQAAVQEAMARHEAAATAPQPKRLAMMMSYRVATAPQPKA